MSEESQLRFAVFAEVPGHPKPLVMTDLSFARLIDDIVIQYDNGDAFFVDGVPVTRDKLKRMKIVQQDEHFDSLIHDLHWRLKRGKDSKVYGDQYHTRLEAAFRACKDDVTSQVIKAFNAEIKPSITEYLPKRSELIQAALHVFLQGVKLLGGS